MKRWTPQDTTVLLIDVQDRLCAAMPETRVSDLLRAASLLTRAAQLLGAKVAYTEQYPKGLGATVPALLASLTEMGAPRLEKLSFSACGAEGWDAFAHLALAPNVAVLGMEAHVCVLQTVQDLRLSGHEVAVVVDGVCSRRDDHREVGVERARAAGASVTTAETLLFDWLGSAAHPAFRELSKLVR